jgi:hypothetical protein
LSIKWKDEKIETKDEIQKIKDLECHSELDSESLTSLAPKN